MTAEEKRLHVALNAVAARPGGGLSYLLGQIPYLTECAELEIFAGPSVAGPLRAAFPDIHIRTIPKWAQPLPLRLVWEHVMFPRLAKNADLLYMIGSFASITKRKPQVVAVLIPYIFGPEGKLVMRAMNAPVSFRLKVALQRLMGRLTVRRATVLIAASQFTADQIRNSVTRNVNLQVVPIAGAEIPAGEAAPTDRWEFDRPYALSVGSDIPHKDQLGLVQAWPTDCGLDLVLAGNGPAVPSTDFDEATGGRTDIHWIGSVEGYARLFSLYRGAAVVVAHSLLEGFGMTPLEAMAQDTPVIASDIPAHREVCGDAALYYDPLDWDNLRDAVRRLVKEPGLAEALAASGRDRLQLFSWAKNGEAICRIFREVAFTVDRSGEI